MNDRERELSHTVWFLTVFCLALLLVLGLITWDEQGCLSKREWTNYRTHDPAFTSSHCLETP